MIVLLKVLKDFSFDRFITSFLKFSLLMIVVFLAIDGSVCKYRLHWLGLRPGVIFDVHFEVLLLELAVIGQVLLKEVFCCRIFLGGHDDFFGEHLRDHVVSIFCVDHFILAAFLAEFGRGLVCRIQI